MSKSQKKKGEKKILRREFLTATGVLATGAVVSGAAVTYQMKPTKVGRERQHFARLKHAKSRIEKKLKMKFATPVTKNRLTINQLKSKRLVKKDIEGLVNEIENAIKKGLFNEVNLGNALDTIHDYMDLSVMGLDDIGTGVVDIGSFTNSLFNGTLMCGSNCWGGGKESKGMACGQGCDGNGHECGYGCSGNEGNNCGHDCRDAPKKEIVNPFVENFMQSTDFNYLDPAVHMIMQFHTADIMRQVVNRF